MPPWTEVYTGVISVPVFSFHLLPGSPVPTARLSPLHPARTAPASSPQVSCLHGPHPGSLGRQKESPPPREQSAVVHARPQVGAIRGPGLPSSSPELSATSSRLGYPSHSPSGFFQLLPSFILSLTRRPTLARPQGKVWALPRKMLNGQPQAVGSPGDQDKAEHPQLPGTWHPPNPLHPPCLLFQHSGPWVAFCTPGCSLCPSSTPGSELQTRKKKNPL